MLQEHMRLLTEKDAIVRRTEYFNVLEQLREVEDEITKLQHKLGSASIIDREFTGHFCAEFNVLISHNFLSGFVGRCYCLKIILLFLV